MSQFRNQRLGNFNYVYLGTIILEMEISKKLWQISTPKLFVQNDRDHNF